MVSLRRDMVVLCFCRVVLKIQNPSVRVQKLTRYCSLASVLDFGLFVVFFKLCLRRIGHSNGTDDPSVNVDECGLK